ncbi:MAG TPA: hypothetical protein VGW38_24405 [Chloroflexota bacterium]|nr:hypothetical protein [Chloroflexota bacterium]
MEHTEPVTRVTLLLPQSLHEQLRRRARREERSLQAQLEYYLRRGLARDSADEHVSGVPDPAASATHSAG